MLTLVQTLLICITDTCGVGNVDQALGTGVVRMYPNTFSLGNKKDLDAERQKSVLSLWKCDFVERFYIDYLKKPSSYGAF